MANLAIVDIDRILQRVSKPARYSGGEWNSVVKDWSRTPLRVALTYPDVYDIGMSNLGLAILYEVLNQEDGVLCERVYAPWTDMEQSMRQEGIPLFSLETRHPLGEFDVIGFSLSYELTYTNVLNMLDLAGLPLLAAERRRALPLIIAGGSGALNPEPLADFIEEEGTAIGCLEQSLLVRRSACEGALHMAEHLRLAQGFGQGCAVDGDELESLAGAGRVYGPGH